MQWLKTMDGFLSKVYTGVTGSSLFSVEWKPRCPSLALVVALFVAV